MRSRITDPEPDMPSEEIASMHVSMHGCNDSVGSVGVIRYRQFEEFNATHGQR
jgi:hypothetical protein